MLNITLRQCCVLTILLFTLVTSTEVYKNRNIRSKDTYDTRNKRYNYHQPETSWTWSDTIEYPPNFLADYHHSQQNTFNYQQSFNNERHNFNYDITRPNVPLNYDPYTDPNYSLTQNVPIPPKIYFNRQPVQPVLQPVYIPIVREENYFNIRRPMNRVTINNSRSDYRNRIIPIHNTTQVDFNLRDGFNKLRAYIFNQTRNGPLNQSRINDSQNMPFANMNKEMNEMQEKSTVATTMRVPTMVGVSDGMGATQVDFNLRDGFNKLLAYIFNQTRNGPLNQSRINVSQNMPFTNMNKEMNEMQEKFTVATTMRVPTMVGVSDRIDASIDAKVFGPGVDLGDQMIGPTGSLINKDSSVQMFSIAQEVSCDEPYEAPKMPNFEAPGRRISEARCYEYIFQLKVKDDLERRNEKCNNTTPSERKNLVSFVFGGRKAEPEEFSHMAAIGWIGNNEQIIFKCGGSIISPNFILSAAHCRSSAPDSELSDRIPRIARIGGNNIGYTKAGQPYRESRRRRQNTDSDQMDVGIVNIITHEQYNPNMQYFDIALMQLIYPLDFNKRIKPACLWIDLQTSDRIKKATASGWGVVNTRTGRTSLNLQAGELDIINVDRCNDLLRGKFGKKFNGFADHQLCAGNLSGSVDVCQGDSGGPLQVKVNLPVTKIGNMHAIVGVISAGPDCAKPNMPGIYTKVASFVDWIESKVWN